jgi:hypothetical protein
MLLSSCRDRKTYRADGDGGLVDIYLTLDDSILQHINILSRPV